MLVVILIDLSNSFYVVHHDQVINLIIMKLTTYSLCDTNLKLVDNKNWPSKLSLFN